MRCCTMSNFVIREMYEAIFSKNNNFQTFQLKVREDL